MLFLCLFVEQFVSVLTNITTVCVCACVRVYVCVCVCVCVCLCVCMNCNIRSITLCYNIKYNVK